MIHQRQRPVQHGAQAENDRKGHFSPAQIGYRCPEKPSQDVKQAEQAGKSCGHGSNAFQLLAVQLMPAEIERQQFAGKDLLQHRRSHTENTDPRGDVEP